MLKTCWLFIIIAFLSLLFADIEIASISTWDEMGKVVMGFVRPDLKIIPEVILSLSNTLIFALLGISIAVVMGSVFAAYYHLFRVRVLCSFLRSIHELFWALLLIPIFGLNALSGILAIAIPFTGIFAKVYAEIYQESDKNSLKGVPSGSGLISTFFYGILPVIYKDIKHYTSYRFECALRSSSVLGFVGFPTIGYHLESFFREGMYSQAGAVLLLFYILIFSLPYWLKPHLIPFYLLISVLFVSKNIDFSFYNLSQFFTVEIVPWPMRDLGGLESYTSIRVYEQLFSWFSNLLENEILEGVFNTIILTQIALVCSGLLALFFFPLASQHFSGVYLKNFTKTSLIVLRTTPEYILAYIFLQIMGPSMLPAIVALTIHNGAIIGYLCAKHCDLVELKLDSPQYRMDRFFFILLPKVSGQLMAYLFYRWEIIMRESAILGILGIYTLGFFIDSAIAVDQLDVAFILILITSLLNLLIDSLSLMIRKSLKVSTKLVTV